MKFIILTMLLDGSPVEISAKVSGIKFLKTPDNQAGCYVQHSDNDHLVLVRESCAKIRAMIEATKPKTKQKSSGWNIIE